MKKVRVVYFSFSYTMTTGRNTKLCCHRLAQLYALDKWTSRCTNYKYTKIYKILPIATICYNLLHYISFIFINLKLKKHTTILQQALMANKVCHLAVINKSILQLHQSISGGIIKFPTISIYIGYANTKILSVNQSLQLKMFQICPFEFQFQKKETEDMMILLFRKRFISFFYMSCK